MRRFAHAAVVTFAALSMVAPLQAQHGSHGANGDVATAVRDDLLGHFGRSSFKMESLSQAMPAELYGWAPQEGLMTVATVYAHIARYNFMYLEENLGIPAPEGIDWQNLESLTDKDAIVSALELSVEHVNEKVGAMTTGQLTSMTELYGRQVHGFSVLTQLVAHMNEHVGQAVAYARMNDIAPPWSR